MGRYFKFDSNTFNFATRCDVNVKYDNFTDFTFGGERDQRIYGLTKITPSLTCAYDVDGLKFLINVLGTVSANGVTVTVADLPEIGSISALVEAEYAGISFAKIDTWDFTIEEGSPAKAEFSAIGKNTVAAGPATYSSDFCSAVLMPSDCRVTINTSSIDFSRFNLKINNGLDPIFKTSTLPTTIRPTGLEIEGKIRVPSYIGTVVTNGSLRLVCGTIGNIDLATIRVTEIPSKVTGYNIPETEYSFTAFPTCNGQAIKAILSNTIKW